MIEFSDSGNDNSYFNWLDQEKTLNQDPTPSPDPTPTAPSFDGPTFSTTSPSSGSPTPAPASGPTYTSVGGEDNPDPFQHYPDQDPNGIPPANTPGGGSSTSTPTPTATPSGNPRDFLINRDKASWEAYLKANWPAGLPFDQGALDGVIRQVSYVQNAGHDPKEYIDAALAYANKRLQPNAAAPGTATGSPGGLLLPPGGSSSNGGASGGRSSGSGPAFVNTSPQFSDPATSLLENYALDQFGRRINPDPNSGTALFEKYARELIDTLKQPVYSPQDEAIIKTQATNAIEQERTATKQRWLEELSRRNIQPSSGIALDGLQQIDNHFASLRTQVDAQFAAQAIDQTRQQRVQVLDTAGQLANAEEARLRDAGTYAQIPLSLADRAFQRNLQLVGAGGSPADLVGSALAQGNFNLNTIGAGANYGLARQNLVNQQALINSGTRAEQTAALLQLIGYMFGA